ncbi:MAG TPA: 50S ribosomal protein L29 [Candidatus Nanoarchaeia archaeon]|nr:50S ribosomal protein L29 [Candidatus Nanoarchaeia archaeon]
MKRKELMKLPEQELQERLVEMQKELMKGNAQRALGTTAKNSGKIKTTRKNIARIKMRMGVKKNV